MTTIGEQLDLTGDGHGHHIPGTPMEYRHGYIPVSGSPVTSIPHEEGVHGYDKPDPARLTSPRSPYKMPADHPFFKKNPVSPEHIMASYSAATPQEKAQGMRWYADAHTVAGAIAGGDFQKGGAVLSAYSPQTGWPANMFNAARSLAENRALGPKDGMITRNMQKVAQGALDGRPMDENFKSPKTNAFAHLIASAGDDDDDHLGRVVIDRHALSVAVGKRMTADDIDGSPIGDDRYYQHVADQYRMAAHQASQAEGHEVTPHQVQAVTWLHQQAANQAQDAASGASRLQRGRTTGTRNQWAKWTEFERAHHIPVVSGTTALSSQAEAIDLAREDWEAGLEPAEIDLASCRNTQVSGGVDSGMTTMTISEQLDLAYNPLQPRDAHGRWSDLNVGAAASLMEREREGFSVSLKSGKAPTSGFMVAQTGRTHTFPASILDDHKALTRAIDSMIMSEPGAFTGGTHLGGWVHDGKLWLEPSDNIADRQHAVSEGVSRNQIAIWDVQGGQEIQTGGSGGGRITEHDASGRAVRTYDEGSN